MKLLSYVKPDWFISWNDQVRVSVFPEILGRRVCLVYFCVYARERERERGRASEWVRQTVRVRVMCVFICVICFYTCTSDVEKTCEWERVSRLLDNNNNTTTTTTTTTTPRLRICKKNLFCKLSAFWTPFDNPLKKGQSFFKRYFPSSLLIFKLPNSKMIIIMMILSQCCRFV